MAMIHIDADRGDKFLKKNQIAVDVGISPLNKAIALLSYSPTTETYRVSISFPDASPLSLVDDYSWKAGKSLSDVSNFSATAVRQGGHVHWHSDGSKLIVFIHNRLHVFSFSWLDKTSEPPRYLLFPDVIFLVQSSYDAALRVPGGQIFDINQVLEVQWTVKANRRDIVGQHLFALTSSLLLLTQTDGFCLIDWHGSLLHHFPLNPLLPPAQAPEPTTPSEEVEDCRDLFRLGLMDSAIAMKATISPLNYELPSMSDDVASSRLDQVRSVVWLEGVQSFFLVFLDGSFALYSLPPSNSSSSSTSNLLNSKVPASPQAPPTPSYSRGGAAVKKLGESALWALLTQKEELATTLAATPVNATPVVVATQPSYNPSRQPSTDVTTLPPPPHSDVIGGVEGLISQRIYFISQVAYPFTSSPSTAPVVYECSREGVYASPYITMKEVQHYCAFPPSVEKKLQRSSLLLEAKCVEEISKVNDVISLEDLPIDALDLHSDVSMILLMTTRHFMDSDVTAAESEEQLQHSRSSEGEDAPKPKPNLIPFMMTYSLVKVALLRSEEEESEIEAASHPQPFSTPVKRMPNATVTMTSAPPLSPVRGRGRGRPQLRLRVVEVCNVARLHCLEQERYHSKLQLHYDSFQHEALLLTWIHLSVTARSTTMMKQHYFTVDLSLVSPDRPLHSSNNEVEEEEVILTKLATLSTSFLHLHHSLQHTRGSAVTFKTRVHRLPASLHLQKPKQVNDSEVVEYDDVNRALLLPSIDQEAVQISYTETSSEGEGEGEEVSRDLIRCHHSSARERVTLPKQLTQALHTHEAFCYHHSLTWHQLYSTSSSTPSTPPLPSHRLAIRATSSSLSLVPSNRLTSLSTPSLFVSISSKRNTTYVTSSPSSPHPMGSAIDRQVLHLSHEVDYVACIVGRKKAAISGAGSNQPASSGQGSARKGILQTSVIYFCQAPELWIFNQQTKRWRNTTLLVGLKEGRARLIKSIPPVHYHLILSSGDDEEVVEEEDQRKRQHSNGKEGQRVMTLSRSQSVGLDSSQYNFYLSASTLASDSTAFDDALHGLSVDIRGHNPRPASSDALLAEEHNPPTPIAQQTRHPTIVIPQDSVERGAASKPPLRRPSHTTQRGVGGAVGAATTRRRSDSDTSKSSDITDATSSTTTGRRSRHRLRTSVETAVTTQGGAMIAPSAATSALSHLLSPTSSSSAATSSNNHLIASSLQVVALNWFDTHTIILLTLRKSIYYIEILSREILRDVYYNANPTTNVSNPHYNHYSVQPKLHKLIPLPIGFIPHHHDVINIVYPIQGTSSAESNSTHSFNPLLNGQTTPKATQAPYHSNFAVVAVSDGKHFLAYQITARFLPAPTTVSELKASVAADTPSHRRQNSGGGFGDNAVRASMTSMNASDSAKMLDNYSFLELFNFNAEEVHTPPSLALPLSLKTMKIYVTQVPSSERQIAVFENLRRNYGDDHYIHYVSLLIVTDSNEHLLLDAPLKTATSLTPPPQIPPTPPVDPHITPLEEVEVSRLSSADFPLHSPSFYQFNDVIAVHHPNHHTSQLRGYHHHLIDRLTHFKLLQRFGKKENKEGGHVTATPLSLPRTRDFLYSTAYLTSVSYDHYLTSQYLGQEVQQSENQRALLQLTLPLPLSSPLRRNDSSGDEVVVEELHGVRLLREGSAVLVSPSLSQPTSSLSKEVMKGVWPRQSTSRHCQQESLLFHLLTLLYERHRHLLIQHLLTTPSDTSSHLPFLTFPLMTSSSSLSSGESEVAFVRQVVHNQLDFFHRSRQSSKLQHLLASLEHYAAQVIRQTTPHLLVPYTSSPDDNSQSSEKTSAKRERRQQLSHSLALPPQVEEYVRQHELYWFTSFCYELHPLLFLEVLTKLVRKLEPRQTHRLFPLCTHLSLTEHDSDTAQTTLSFHTTMTSVFEVMENALLPRHLVDYLIRYLSFLCEHVGGSDTLLHTFVCLFYVSEVFYQSIVTLALTKASDVIDFSLRLEDMLFQFNTLHQQKQQKKSSTMTSERESMKDVVMSRLETLKRHSRQSHYKHSLAMFQRLQHLLDNTTSASTTSAQSPPQSPNGTTMWDSLGVSWLLSSIGLTSSTTTSEEGRGNGVSRRRKKVVKMVQGSDVSHPSTPQNSTTSSTTFKSLELLEQFLSLDRLNALLTHSLPQRHLIPPPSTPSLLEQLNSPSSTSSLTKPSSLMWHLLGGVLYDWLVVQRKRLYHTVAFVLLSLLKSPKNERLLQHHLYLLLFTSPSNDDTVQRHCQQRLFPAHYDNLIGGSSKDKSSDDVNAFIVERYEVVSKIFIVLRMHKYVRRIRSLSVSIDTGSKKSAESRQLLREHQLTCLDYCQQPLPQQYLKKLVDVEYHHTSFTSLKQQKGVTSAPPQQRNPSLDEQSSHSQSLHRLEASLALLEPATSASTHGIGMTSSSSLSTSVIDNRYFPLYFESPLYSPDDDDVTPLEPRQHLLDKNCFYSASLWQEYVDKISLSARSKERRHLPLHLPTDSEEAEVTSMQLLRGVILAHLLVAEIHIPLMLLYDIRSLLHDDIHFLLSQLFSDEFAEDNSLTSLSSKTSRRSLSVEERMEIIQFIFLEFLFPNLQQK